MGEYAALLQNVNTRGHNLRYSTHMQKFSLDLERLPESNEKRVVTRLNGGLTLETVHHFLQTLRAEPAPQLLLDMSRVPFVDSSGVGALVQIYVHRRNAGKGFAIAGLTKQGNAVMQVAGLTKLLPIHSTVEEALAHIS